MFVAGGVWMVLQSEREDLNFTELISTFLKPGVT
jgi:hypothetical protein